MPSRRFNDNHIDREFGVDHRTPAPKPRFEVAPNTPRVRVSDIAWTGSVEKAEKKAQERKRSIITKSSKLVPDPVQPSEPLTPVVIEQLKEHGRELGFTDEQMLNVMEKRLHHRDWEKLVPFNVTVLKMVFARGPSGW